MFMSYVSSFTCNVRDILGVTDSLFFIIIFVYLCFSVAVNTYLYNALMMSHLHGHKQEYIQP